MELKRHCLRPHKEKVDLPVFSNAVLGLERRHQVIDTMRVEGLGHVAGRHEPN